MTVPDFQSLMLPILQLASERNNELSTNEIVEGLAKRLNLTEEDVKEILPSGIQTTFFNRASWACTYLKKALLLEATRRGHCQITMRGKELVKTKPKFINTAFLDQYPEFSAFRSSKKKETPVETPSEALEAAYDNLRNELAAELLGKLKKIAPSFFERIVVELLVKMGYGGSRADAGKAIGKSGDGGIDGIIKEDKLGLDVVYIQAKRWDKTSIGSPDVMQFAGALQAQKANKGIFITTSKFTEEAKGYVSQIGSKIVLIDGELLTDLMIEHNVGVSVVNLYPVKKIDGDYFEEG